MADSSYSYRKRTKATMVEGINPIPTKKIGRHGVRMWV